MKFGQYFKTKRIQSGLTQKDISDFLELGSIQMISNVERGICYLSKKNLKSLCVKYKWDYEKFAKMIVEEKSDKLEKEWLGA